MSYSANKTAIGVFTVVFVTVLTACIIFFGKFSLSNNTEQYVIYTEDSLNGLDIGSAVKFKGVKIGSVKSIRMNLQERNADEVAIPVIIEIKHADNDFGREKLSDAIRAGLRARLQLTSIVTGLLYVDLDFVPGTPIVLHDKADGIDLPEIPTIPSNTEQMMKSVTTILRDLSDADFSELSFQLKIAAERMNQGLSAIEFKKINDNVVRLTDSAATLLEDPELKTAVANINRLLAEIETLSQNISGQIDPTAQEIRTSLAELRSALSEISGAVTDFQNLITPRQGSLGQEFGDALVQINDAARAVRALAEYFQVQLISETPEKTEK